MARLLIRLAGPAQSYGGYRYRVNDVPGSPVPTKSAVAGMLGACLGVTDYLTLMDHFTMRVRVDRTNPAQIDLQVTSGSTPFETRGILRTLFLDAPVKENGAAISYPKATSKTVNPTGGAPAMAARHYIPCAEFIVEITVDDALAEEWARSLRYPAHTPYLGRVGNAPSFPFYLGRWNRDGDALAELPWVRRDADAPRPVVMNISGNRRRPETGPQQHVDPTKANRDEQLAWMKENLSR